MVKNDVITDNDDDDIIFKYSREIIHNNIILIQHMYGFPSLLHTKRR